MYFNFKTWGLHRIKALAGRKRYCGDGSQNGFFHHGRSLDFGGFLGIKDKYFAIPWDALEVTSDKSRILIDATKRDLKKAPGFDKNNWPDFGDLAQTTLIYEFYGVPVPNVSGEHKATR